VVGKGTHVIDSLPLPQRVHLVGLLLKHLCPLLCMLLLGLQRLVQIRKGRSRALVHRTRFDVLRVSLLLCTGSLGNNGRSLDLVRCSVLLSLLQTFELLDRSLEMGVFCLALVDDNLREPFGIFPCGRSQ
jgi:hypothetical protein